MKITFICFEEGSLSCEEEKIFLLEITPNYASFFFEVSKSVTTFCYHADLISSGGPDFSLSFGTGFKIQGCPLAEFYFWNILWADSHAVWYVASKSEHYIVPHSKSWSSIGDLLVGHANADCFWLGPFLSESPNPDHFLHFLLDFWSLVGRVISILDTTANNF